MVIARRPLPGIGRNTLLGSPNTLMSMISAKSARTKRAETWTDCPYIMILSDTDYMYCTKVMGTSDVLRKWLTCGRELPSTAIRSDLLDFQTPQIKIDPRHSWHGGTPCTCGLRHGHVPTINS